MISGIDYAKGNDESCTITFVSPEYIKRLEQENKEQEEYITYWQKETDKRQDKIDKAIEDITFCINGMKNEYACVDYRTDRELHTMVNVLEDTIKVLKDSDVDE